MLTLATTKKEKMYNKIFEELVNNAVLKSDSYYQGQDMSKPNPYYIGFGNPNSKLLIIGQEKAIDGANEYGKIQMQVESTDNPYQWKKIIDEKIIDLDYKFNNPTHFRNPRFPYNGKPPKGNTWNQYQLLVSKLFPHVGDSPNSFLNETFITEVNHSVSSRKLGNERNSDRINFMTHAFFESFPMIIIAAGDYLNKEEIEKQFNLDFVKDLSESHRKLIIFEDKKNQKVLINTRQFSNLFFNKEKRNAYFEKICNELQKYNG